jgi:hypothetical protein
MMNSGGIARAVLALVATMVISGSAWAQYGGGGGGMGSSGGGTYNPGSRSYGNGAKIGAAVGGAAGAGLLFYALHRRHAQAQVVGCVAPDGKSLKTDNGKKTFQLAGEPLSPGEHLSVVGKKMKDTSGIDELEVSSVQKHMGQCEQSTAIAVTP